MKSFSLILIISFSFNLNNFASIDKKIIHGWQVNITEFPFSVLVFILLANPSEKSDGRICGGSIIDRFWILTAAHCFIGYSNKSLYFLYGSESVESTNSRYERISKVFNHPDYDKNNHLNDISLIKTFRRLPFSKRNKPIKLIRNGEKINSVYGLVAGFGSKLQNEDDRTTKYIKLHASNVKIEKCEDEKYYHIQMCGSWIESSGPCIGDSGSALISLRENSEKILIGIVSFGDDCHLNRTRVTHYTKVSSYLKWIESIMDTN